MFENLPLEMREFRQWIVWRFEDCEGSKPTKVPYSPITHRPVSVRDANSWGSYDDAVNVARSNNTYAGIGFVLTEADPYAFIDLDDTGGDRIEFDRQMKIYNQFDSYAELSPSGNGLHIIVRGAIPSGRRRSKIEIYSNLRFMTMTGNVHRGGPIGNYHDLLNVLYEQMGGDRDNSAAYMGNEPETQSDEELVAAASTAANGEKFYDLYSGNWHKHYASQSEADMALVDIIAYYTFNRQQVARVFRESALGQRAKAQRVDYVDYMLNKCFDNRLPPIDFDGLRNQLDEVLAQRARMNPDPTPQSEIIDDFDETAGIIDAAPVVTLENKRSVYSPPPGLMGEIAQFIYSAAPRPVPEIALAGAMGLMAGIVGRAYNVSGTGLNSYTMLLAGTGTGKEAIARGISRLIKEVGAAVPTASEFIGPGEIASPQAITKFMSKGRTSFVSVLGEFGLYLRTMSGPFANPNMLGIKRFLLDVFNKSGNGDSMQPSIYADSDKNTAVLNSPNLCIIGESTPERFYESIDEEMISEGLIPRFTIIEYIGKRPPLNRNHESVMPSFNLVTNLASLCGQAMLMNSQNKHINVLQNREATARFEAFDTYCDDRINSDGSRDYSKQLWNRAHIKALKLAATVAVGCNPYDPVIDLPTAEWAIGIICADAQGIESRFNAGRIGANSQETDQLEAVTKALKHYVTSPISTVEKYVGGLKNVAHLHKMGIVPFSYVSRKVGAAAAFRKDARGATDAVRRTLRIMIDRGDIIEIPKGELIKNHGAGYLAFAVANAKGLGL